MSSRVYITVVISFFAYILAQALFLKNFILFDTAFCFVYIGFILMLPLEIGPLLLMLISFGTGFTVDLFYDSIGVNAAASVFIGFLRPYWLNIITPRGGYEEIVIPNLKTIDFGWFLTYSIPLIFLHHSVLFYLEAGGFALFFFTLTKVFFSTILTFFILVLTQYLFYKKAA
jgi:hypothetical protein